VVTLFFTPSSTFALCSVGSEKNSGVNSDVRGLASGVLIVESGVFVLSGVCVLDEDNRASRSETDSMGTLES